MSTRARVGILHTDGSTTTIYTHWDGYPSHHAPILMNHYGTLSKVKALMRLGSLSSLGPAIGVKHPFDSPTHTPEHMLMCTAYRRDRGEPYADTKSVKAPTVQDTEREEYLYLFDEAKGYWLIEDAPSLIPLELAGYADI